MCPGELRPSGTELGATLQRGSADIVPAVRRQGERSGGGEEAEAGVSVRSAVALRSGSGPLQGSDRVR